MMIKIKQYICLNSENNLGVSKKVLRHYSSHYCVEKR